MQVGGGAAIVNGDVLRTSGTPDLAITLAWAVAWAYAVTAAMIVFRGVLVGEPIDGVTALRRAMRRGHVVLGVLVVAFVSVVAAVLLAGLAAGFLGPLAFVVLALALFFPTRIVAAFPLAALDGQGVWAGVGRTRELADGRRWQLFWLCVGIVVLPVPVYWVRDALESQHLGLWKVFLADLAVSVLIAAVIALQASVLARWRFRLDGRLPPETSPSQPDRWREALAIHAAVALVAVAAVLANPFGMPILAASGFGGGHSNGVGYALTADGRLIDLEDCTGCATPPPQYVWHPNRAFLEGGRTSIQVAHTGPGKPLLTTCISELCDTAVAELDKPGSPRYAGWIVRTLPAGGLAVVTPVMQQDDKGSRTDVVAWFCPDRGCSTSRRVVLADGVNMERDHFTSVFPVSGPSVASVLDFQLAAIVVDGRLSVAYNEGRGRAVTVARCADPTCSSHEDQHAFLEDPGLLAGFGFDADGRLVVVGAEQPAPPQSGLRLHVGREVPPTYYRAVCRPEGPCEGRTTWGIVTDASMRAWPVTMPDGRPALIVREDGSARLVICERNCAP